MAPDLMLPRKLRQAWIDNINGVFISFLESLTRTDRPSEATSTHSVPATDAALRRQMRAAGRPDSTIGFFLGVQEGTYRALILLASARADFPPCPTTLLTSSRRTDEGVWKQLAVPVCLMIQTNP